MILQRSGVPLERRIVRHQQGIPLLFGDNQLLPPDRWQVVQCFITTTEQQNKCVINLTKINPISWTKVESQFKAPPNNLAIAKIAIFEAFKSLVNSVLRIFVLNGLKPFNERPPTIWSPIVLEPDSIVFFADVHRYALTLSL